MIILPWISLLSLSLSQREGDVKLWHALDESKYDFGDRTGNSIGYGVLLVYYENQWGTVCDTGFTQNSADVVCSQLGFTRAEKVRIFYFFLYYKFRLLCPRMNMHSDDIAFRTF